MVVGRVTYPTTMAASTLNNIKLNILGETIWFKIIKKNVKGIIEFLGKYLFYFIFFQN
jgi:hypothetical protein